MGTIRELKLQANQSLKENRTVFLLEYLTVLIISIALTVVLGLFTHNVTHGVLDFILLLFVQLLTFGFIRSGIDLTDGRGIEYSNILDSFRHNFIQRLLLIIIIFFINVVAFTCFILPGIYLKFRLGLAYYIMVDKDCTAIEAIKESWRLTKGYTMKYFLITLSFIGWFLLVVVTSGVASLWVVPYYITTISQFYKELKSIQS